MAWEIDWSRRKRIKSNQFVWARNPTSYQERSRDWHWTTWYSLTKLGIEWKRQRPILKRYVSKSKGYAIKSKSALSRAEIALADAHNLWIGNRRGRERHYGVWEHQLEAWKKYGRIPDGCVIRHRNGNKTDNRHANLLIGTRKENAMDHKGAYLLLMYWRERALSAEGKNVLDYLG